MRHFVRFAKVSASGSVDRDGWRLRIFLTWSEARAFARQFASPPWRVELGAYDDGDGAAFALPRRPRPEAAARAGAPAAPAATRFGVRPT